MRKDCPECGTALVNIQVLDRGFLDSPQKGLIYTDLREKKGMLGQLKTHGTVEALMCDDCGRVLFFAAPKK